MSSKMTASITGPTRRTYSCQTFHF
uniref:Uncharacterized protein n=1 Tax=Rhizophora mucronata TaxID=61149 RepID=A0A2P2MZ31_RHIMU